MVTGGRRTAARTAIGAMIAARRADLGVHVVEVAAGQFDVVLRLGGPWRHYEDAHRAARLLTDSLAGLLPGPAHAFGERNPRSVLIRPIPPPPRKTT